jgi:hypothetical protein
LWRTSSKNISKATVIFYEPVRHELKDARNKIIFTITFFSLPKSFQVEAERKQAEEMAEARQQRMKQFNKEYRRVDNFRFSLK